jgi:uncharacterized protein (DUF924 family)
MQNAIATPADVLDFWFGPSDLRSAKRAEWFRKSDEFDDEIRRRFLATYESAAAGALDHWMQKPEDCLALIVVLDQFPRNMFRGSARAFAADAHARTATRHLLSMGWHQSLRPVERQFVYLPLEHSENMTDQEQCHELMHVLSVFPETADLHVWSMKHLVIIKRFGRFSHRNAALGRASTAEEIEFLAQPGSGF